MLWGSFIRQSPKDSFEPSMSKGDACEILWFRDSIRVGDENIVNFELKAVDIPRKQVVQRSAAERTPRPIG